MGSRDSRSKERSIGIVCLLVFSVFSFCWLFFLQGHLIGRAYESMIIAHNGIQGNYNRLLMAVLGTMLLDTIALSSRAIIRNKGFMYAVDYAIPALLLGAFTGYDGQNMLSQTATAWIVSSVILILMFLTALAIKSYRLMHAGNIKPVFAMNLLLMTLALSVTAILGNTDEILHRKLLMERCLEQSKYENVLEIGRHEEESDADMEHMRVKAMLSLPSDVPGSHVGDRLFQYPVGNGKALSAYLRNMASADSLRHDEILCAAALVERDLQRFDSIADVSRYQGTIPIYYMQAMVLLDSEEAKAAFPEQYRTESERYESFMNALEKVADKPLQYRKNATFIEFHETYYWYYNFSL